MSSSARSAGILLHPTCLPNRFGIGDFGAAAEQFLEWASRAGQSWWQILPLGPPRKWGSPYDTRSSFAGNPLLISPERLHRSGLVTSTELDSAPPFEPTRVAFNRVGEWKFHLLRSAWKRSRAQPIEEFRHQNQTWLEDWAVFQVLSRKFQSANWWHWSPLYAQRHGPTLTRFRQREQSEIEFHCFVQSIFFSQWHELRLKARALGIRIFGDLPIYVAHASADVWTAPGLFALGDDYLPTRVSGAPPDDYSADGQLWRNPLYDWSEMARDRYRWWVARLRGTLDLCDLVRLDHFRGFVAFWSVAGNDPPNAIDGRWVEGPGVELFEAFRKSIGPSLPLVAEDLGVVTPDVDELRQLLAIPGTRVLQFGLDDITSVHAPANLSHDAIVYTGTHDSDTSQGWFSSLDDVSRQRVEVNIESARRRQRKPLQSIAHEMIALAYESPGQIAIVPLQDILGLGSQARMNVPGVTAGNWAWRFTPDDLDPRLADRVRALVDASDRSSPRHP